MGSGASCYIADLKILHATTAVLGRTPINCSKSVEQSLDWPCLGSNRMGAVLLYR